MAVLSRTFLWWLSSFCIVSQIYSETPHKDSFTEELFIKPLSSGHVYNYFLFTTRWKIESDKETCTVPVSYLAASWSPVSYFAASVSPYQSAKTLSIHISDAQFVYWVVELFSVSTVLFSQSSISVYFHFRWARSSARNTSKNCTWPSRKADGNTRNGDILSKKHRRGHISGPGSMTMYRGTHVGSGAQRWLRRKTSATNNHLSVRGEKKKKRTEIKRRPVSKKKNKWLLLAAKH